MLSWDMTPTLRRWYYIGYQRFFQSAWPRLLQDVVRILIIASPMAMRWTRTKLLDSSTSRTNAKSFPSQPATTRANLLDLQNSRFYLFDLGDRKCWKTSSQVRRLDQIFEVTTIRGGVVLERHEIESGREQCDLEEINECRVAREGQR